MKKLELTKMQKLILCLVLVLGLFVSGIFIQNSKALFGDGTSDKIVDNSGTAGQIAKTATREDGTAGQKT